ncbi:hypothetical protein ATE67_02345 [Sphingopyxis sp. H050]|nr:hypothetical protein ATE67_02345 [Sphingopyxis sp. H050]
MNNVQEFLASQELFAIRKAVPFTGECAHGDDDGPSPSFAARSRKAGKFLLHKDEAAEKIVDSSRTRMDNITADLRHDADISLYRQRI